MQETGGTGGNVEGDGAMSDAPRKMMPRAFPIDDLHEICDAELADVRRELAAKSAEVERLREELAQVASEAWDAAYQRAQTEWTAEVTRLKDALEHLIERCDTSDDFRYGTLSTSFVREVASDALSEAGP